ncbi:hypothetical protein Jormungand_gp5 [Pelagibacter phage Jormungand EXVC012P]|nr:hypothetical protein Jormungand_gp5 [Pelagibacter phage Jormungand EXVC012P]QLF88534.1 hypothetical protein Ran_gp28 [Pelagibacter phage Ran EXVC014P]
MKHYQLDLISRQLNEKAVLWNDTKDPQHKTDWDILLKKFNQVYTQLNPPKIFTDLQ